LQASAVDRLDPEVEIAIEGAEYRYESDIESTCINNDEPPRIVIEGQDRD